MQEGVGLDDGKLVGTTQIEEILVALVIDGDEALGQVVVGIGILVKMQRANDEMIRQIEEFTK